MVIKDVLKITIMNKYLVFAIVSALAVGSMFSVGGATVNFSVLAQNMTMNNSTSAPIQNTTEIGGMASGSDGNMSMGDNISASNVSGLQ